LAELSGAYLAQLEESVAAIFARAVALHRDSVALEIESETLTYEELDRASNRLAHAILARCDGIDRPVAFIIDGGASPYICVLAALKAGKAYVALDPKQPLAQLRSVCTDVEPALILSTSNNTLLATQLAGEACGWLDIDALDVGLSGAAPALVIPPSRPAAIFFTSGTTGQPKSIYYDQRALLHRIFTTVLCIDMRPGERQALHVLCDRTWSATIMFSTLFSGATLYPVDIKAIGVPRMAEWAASASITHFPLTCSVFREWMDVLPCADERRYPALRFISVGAEALARQDVERFKQHFSPECVLFHSLATSECGRISYVKIRRETPLRDERVPVGHADLDKEILIVGADGRPVASGEEGEIAVRSRYMMTGYWRKPELTAAVIRSDPGGSDKKIYYTGDIGRIRPDGQLELIGRRDFQVKVRGFSCATCRSRAATPRGARHQRSRRRRARRARRRQTIGRVSRCAERNAAVGE
jgi:non-ribosomal peptide synthetase component F